MARKFNFVISADNNAALRAIRSVNRELYKINKPFRDMKSAISAFGRESGFNTMIKGFKGTAEAAGDVASKIASILTPLVAVTGFTSLAGVVGMADHWANLGRQIELTKYQTGMSEDQIQSWIGAGRMFGITTEQMTGTLTGFSSALEDAVFGRNQNLMGTLDVLGVKNLKQRLGDPESVLREVAGKLQNFNPLARHAAIQNMGLGGIEPMMMDGVKGFDRAMEARKKYGYNQSKESIESAKNFSLAIFEAGAAVEGLGNKISEKLLPILSPLVTQFANWVANNRELIGEKVAEFASEVGEALKDINLTDILNGMKEFGRAIKSVVDLLGGWRNALIALGVIMAAPLIAAILTTGVAIVQFGVMIAAVAPEVLILVGALTALYAIKLKLAQMAAVKQDGHGLENSINNWKKFFGFGPDESQWGGMTPVPGGMSPVPGQIPFYMQGGMSMIPQAPNPISSLSGMALVNPDVNKTASMVSSAVGGNFGGGASQVEIGINLQNLPDNIKPTIQTKGNIKVQSNIYHSEALSSGISP